MSSFTRENTEVALELDGQGTQHRAEAGGFHVALEQWKAGLDTEKWFAELPGGACQEPHWGYVIAGAFTARYAEGDTETLSAGQTYYLRPGHNVHIDSDVDLVEFTRADETPGVNTLEV